VRGNAKSYDELRAYCESVPLVDCHDHSGECGPRYEDPILFIAAHYSRSDLLSATSDAEVAIMEDTSLPLEERWPVLKRAWERTKHTGYTLVTRMIMREFYGEDELTLDALRRMQKRFMDLTDPAVYDGLLEKAGIAARLEDVWHDVSKALDGTLELPPRSRLMIGCS